MECHKCRHSAAVESGKYSGRFFRHSPCYRCELTHNSHYTMEFKPWMHERAAEVESEPEPDRGPLWEAMLEMAKVLLTLRPEYRNCVCWRLQGITTEEIAKRQGVTPGAIQRRLMVIRRDYPVMRKVIRAGRLLQRDAAGER